MNDDQSFIFGFRTRHCVKAIVLFTSAVVLDVWRVVDTRSTFTRVLCGAIAVFFGLMTVTMTRWLVVRRRGTKRIVVGPKTLSAPSGMMFSAPILEIPYDKMRSASASAGSQGRLLVDSELGPLEISRQMLGSDAEFDKLTTLVQQRIARAR